MIRTPRSTRSRRAKAKQLVDELRGYLTDNLDRMAYPAYRGRGLRVAGGASANFPVTAGRPGLHGMRWSAEGPGHVAALCATPFNDRWEMRTRELLDAWSRSPALPGHDRPAPHR